MSKGQRYIIVDEYAVGLLQQIVDQGKAGDLSDAVCKSAASYLLIRYKSKQERKLEQELAHIQELGKRAMGENNGTL